VGRRAENKVSVGPPLRFDCFARRAAKPPTRLVGHPRRHRPLPDSTASIARCGPSGVAAPAFLPLESYRKILISRWVNDVRSMLSHSFRSELSPDRLVGLSRAWRCLGSDPIQVPEARDPELETACSCRHGLARAGHMPRPSGIHSTPRPAVCL